MSVVKPKMFWPLTIDSTNCVIPYKIGSTEHTVSIAAATYLSAETLRTAVEAAIAGGTGMSACTVSLNLATGIFTFVDASDAARIWRWSLTTNSAYQVLGFDAVDSASSQANEVGDYQHSNGWYSPVPPTKDSLPVRDRKLDVVTRVMSGQTKFLSENELTNRGLMFQWLPAESTYKAFEGSAANRNKAIERLWESGRSKFRYWPDALTSGTYFDYVMDLDTIKEFKPERQFPKKALYSFFVGCFGYVS